ncbi:hypothetical protein Tco_0004030 [Tanacetum coccineum]
MSQSANDEFSQHLSDDEESNHENASDTGAAPKQRQQQHYLSYIDNEVEVIQEWNSKKRILPKVWMVLFEYSTSRTDAEFKAIERKGRKSRKPSRTRFGGNANSKKMQKAVLKQQFKRDPFYPKIHGVGKKELKNRTVCADNG